MLKRLFSKTRPEDLRVHYRRALGKGVALGVQAVSSDGLPMSGHLVDLSAGGASIEFDDRVERELELGSEKELVFSSLTSTPVRVRAIVRTTPEDGEPRRYGFEFLETKEFHGALQEGFFKFFNRRRHRRAQPALGEDFIADIQFGGVERVVRIHDISLKGATFHIEPELFELLSLSSEIELSFIVPKTDMRLVHQATVKNVTVESRGIRVGVALDPMAGSDTRRNIKRAEAALSDYIDRRLREMDSYNTAYN
ncbi:MAG: PilZ domain-containing protein [Planctomycetota bacterium]